MHAYVCVCVWHVAADDSVAAKILSYNRANRAVAVLCNHQRAVPKTFAKSMENLQNKVGWPGFCVEICLVIVHSVFDLSEHWTRKQYRSTESRYVF